MRKQLLKWMSLMSVALAVLLFAAERAVADNDDDPPSRVARLAYTGGSVSFNPAGTDDWVTAVVNRPMTTGDKLWSDDRSRAELHLDTAVIRLSDHTGFSFLNLTDEITQLRLTEGTLYIRVRRLGDDETFEVDTPNLAFSILRPGRYRINVNEAGDATIVAVRDGQGEVTGGGSAYAIHAREEGVFNGTDQLDADVERIREDEDGFDQWCYERDRRDDHSVSSRYVSDDVVGYEDLDEYGGWRAVPEYGNVWFPHTVVVGWAPYRYGHWVWIAPWGWTWVDDEPWGFAPFHYGRWVAVGGVWGWVPCPPRPAAVTVAYVRPVYAPALVAWVGGAHWGVGVAVGSAPAAGVAWFPLGPRDVYCPSYHVSQTYVTNVNVSNTTIVNRTQITNVYNNVYVNKTVNVTNVTYQNQAAPNAVTAVSHQAFVSAQPVHNNLMRVGQKEFTAAPVAPIAPAVAPEQRSVLGAGAAARVRPPSPVLSRPVVAKVAPPPPPVAFVKQQEIVRENGGRPPAIAEMRRAEPENVQAARPMPMIKMAPPVRQGPAQNAPMNRADLRQENGNRPGPAQNAPMVRPDNANRPAPPNVTSQPNQSARPGNGAESAGNSSRYNDRPPSSRRGNSGANDYSPQLEQKHQQELQDLRNKQDQERQKVEQQQVQQRQKLDQDNTRRQQQQADPRQQQQSEQRQQQTVQRQQQTVQRQQQLEQRQNQQLQQLEQKHDQQQQRLEQKQQQEHQKPSKQEAKQDKPSKSDKPHR